MAPTRHAKKRKLTSSSKKVLSGRVNRSEPAQNYVNKNKGKELIPTVDNAHKELFPDARNATKELFPQLLPSVLRSSMNIHTRDRMLAPIVKHPRRTRPRSKALIAIQAANRQQRHAKQIQDGITKRLQAMEFEADHVVEDARFTSTISFKSARLDLRTNVDTPSRRKLQFSIAIGFWGFAPTFTPIKIFSLSFEQFADTRGLTDLLLANTDVKKATAQIGLDINNVTFVGYEMQFPKGYRYTNYTENDVLGKAREPGAPFKVVQSGELVLVNTECAMREFFWQARHYASDENGKVLVQVVGRVGKATSSGYETFGPDWRSDEEKGLATEEKKRYLEKQSFVNGKARKTLREKMRAIEERSRIAVQNAQAQKQQSGENIAVQGQIAESSFRPTEVPLRNVDTTIPEDNLDKLDLDHDLDLDIDIDLDLEIDHA